MDIKTISRVLTLIEPQVDTQQFEHIHNILRKEYLMDEIEAREEYLSRRIRTAALIAQYTEELPRLQAQLAAL